MTARVATLPCRISPRERQQDDLMLSLLTRSHLVVRATKLEQAGSKTRRVYYIFRNTIKTCMYLESRRY